jgi:hypothetical protein
MKAVWIETYGVYLSCSWIRMGLFEAGVSGSYNNSWTTYYRLMKGVDIVNLPRVITRRSRRTTREHLTINKSLCIAHTAKS